MRHEIDLAVVAKGAVDPEPFFAALDEAPAAGLDRLSVHIAHDADWRGPSAHPAAAVVLHAMPSGTSLPALWAEALHHCRAPYVGVLDLMSPPDASWWPHLAEQLDKETPAFFGAVEPGWQGRDRAIVGYLAMYAQFAAPLADWLDEVPGSNVVFQRSLLPSDEVLARDGFIKTYLVWRLEQERGLRVAPVEGLSVRYRKGFRAGDYLVRRFTHGRCFGGTRHQNPGQPSRLVCLLFCPALPALRLWRIVRACRRRGDLRRALARQIGWVVASEVLWSAGEFVGYAIGAGRSCERD